MQYDDCPRLREIFKHSEVKERIHLITLRYGNHSYKYWVIERFSLQQTLSYLATFCNLFVYSHGLRDYVIEILKQIDPEKRFFRDYDQNVIAPVDNAEQEILNHKRKCFSHFKRDGQPMFTAEEAAKCIIVDDQVNAIAADAADVLILSKKF